MGVFGALKSGVLSSCTKFQKPFFNNVKGEGKGLCVIYSSIWKRKKENSCLMLFRVMKQ